MDLSNIQVGDQLIYKTNDYNWWSESELGKIESGELEVLVTVLDVGDNWAYVNVDKVIHASKGTMPPEKILAIDWRLSPLSA